MNNKWLVAIFAFTFFSCERADLPEITEEGKNTFGMLVDGKVWTPFNLSIMSQGLSVSYYMNSSTLTISAYNSLRVESTHFYFSDIVGPGDYYFDCGSDIPDSVSLFDNCRTGFYKDISTDNKLVNNFVLINKNESNLHLTKLDTISKIVSGTFSVNLYNCNGNMLEITNGRFDVKYQKH